jgi:beta-aspartyl-peptidase (threonine type)
LTRYALAIHGGAGLIRRNALSAEREAACLASLHRIIGDGRTLLAAGASALDTVEACVIALEEDPLFNAGKGAVFASNGVNELDAAIMDGRSRSAGAVAMVRTIRNPIRAARAVMTATPHVLMMGRGAEQFATDHGLEIVSSEWFQTDERLAQLERARAAKTVILDHDSQPDVYGTVGAVACDADGNVAAASSTGGMVNKRPGRIGDTPIIGAGTWAWNHTAAVAGTGHGEPFIRLGACGRVSALMEMSGLSLHQAADQVVRDLVELGGKGGIIGADRNYNLAMPYNTAGMFRASIAHNQAKLVAIW